MKQLKSLLLVILLCLALLPLLAPLGERIAATVPTSRAGNSSAASARISASELLAAVYGENAVTASNGVNTNTETDFTVYLTEEEKLITLSPYDYLRGAVAAEIPLTYGDEAIKAQIIAAHTYALSYKIRERQSPDEALHGADISDDPSAGQAYISDKEIHSRYGENAEELIENLDALIEQCGDYIMLYEGEPIVAAYHAISCGKTESAQNVWGAYSPYLVAVDSGEDESSPDYLSKVMFSVAEVKRLLTEKGAKVKTDDCEDWFSKLLYTPSGYVAYADFGGCQLSGAQLRELFGLRSACFTAEVINDVFTFTVKGWGHGVGMSQYGAQTLAAEGKDFRQILENYYIGVTLCEL